MPETRTVGIGKVSISIYQCNLLAAQPAKTRLTVLTGYFVAALNFANERMTLGTTFRVILEITIVLKNNVLFKSY